MAANKTRTGAAGKSKLLQNKGVDLYPARIKRTHPIAEARALFLQAEEAAEAEDREEADAGAIEVTVVGRVRRLNAKGKISFAHIEDESGRVQLFLRVNTLGDERYDLIRRKLIDVDDFVQASGAMMRTRAGEVSVNTTDIRLISKAMTPLPVVKQQQRADGTIIEYGEFKDKESRYRQRYADLAVNKSVRDIFHQTRPHDQSAARFP